MNLMETLASRRRTVEPPAAAPEAPPAPTKTDAEKALEQAQQDVRQANEIATGARERTKAARAAVDQLSAEIAAVDDVDSPAFAEFVARKTAAQERLGVLTAREAAAVAAVDAARKVAVDAQRVVDEERSAAMRARILESNDAVQRALEDGFRVFFAGLAELHRIIPEATELENRIRRARGEGPMAAATHGARWAAIPVNEPAGYILINASRWLAEAMNAARATQATT